MAKTYLLEAVKRDETSKILEGVRETRHAEDHLAAKYPDLTREVRDFRKGFESCAYGEKVLPCVKEDMFKRVDELIDKTWKLVKETVPCPTCVVKPSG